jgi:hypothetical protein
MEDQLGLGWREVGEHRCAGRRAAVGVLIVWDFIRFAKENGVPVGPQASGEAGGQHLAFRQRAQSTLPPTRR